MPLGPSPMGAGDRLSLTGKVAGGMRRFAMAAEPGDRSRCEAHHG
jgi:hypothetical protein